MTHPTALPPGQTLTRKWPLLHMGPIPQFDRATWRLEVVGCVERPLSLDWGAFSRLPRVRQTSDFHCVTAWSKQGMEWEGVPFAELAARAGVLPRAAHALVHAENDYTTSLPLSELLREDVLLADIYAGADLAPEHGGPLRLVVPQLYAWKSAKWVRKIELLETEVLGYWERNGYARVGDPWTEDRRS